MNVFKRRMEYLREQIENENISYQEILELKSLRNYIEDDDVQLLQWIEEEYDEKNNISRSDK